MKPKPKFSEVRAYLERFPEYFTPPFERSIPLRCFDTILSGVRRQFGEETFAWLMDCFMPKGKPVAPGIEDSLEYYAFVFSSWEEAEAAWNEDNGNEVGG